MFSWFKKRKRRSLTNPCLIQRCELKGAKLIYQYMGMSEFEGGSQQRRSLERIFEEGVCKKTVTVEVEGQTVEVHLLAGSNFSFEKYLPHLTRLANEKRHRPEPTYFNEVIRIRLGLLEKTDYITRHLNAWFDFENDVLWVLSIEELEQIGEALENRSTTTSLEQSLSEMVH